MNLSETHPHLMAEWHPSNTLNSSDVRSDQIAKWICSKGHQWETQIVNRTRKTGNGRGCKICSSTFLQNPKLAETHPHLVAEWHSDNALTPFDVTHGSNYKIKWICTEGHIWNASTYNRIKSTGCPTCYLKYSASDFIRKGRLKLDQSLAKTHPHLVAEWHPDNKLTPFDFSFGSEQSIKWICAKGHEWTTAICSRTKPSKILKIGCMVCYDKQNRSDFAKKAKLNDKNSLAKVFPHLVSEWHPDNKLTPSEVTFRSGQKAKWICSKGHEWEALISNRSAKGCPYCGYETQMKRLMEMHYGNISAIIAHEESRYINKETIS
jgi:lysophospholipid acyltransferase (LPLAT)-like uncharacterized protein